jgi:hypothetical protein
LDFFKLRNLDLLPIQIPDSKREENNKNDENNASSENDGNGKYISARTRSIRYTFYVSVCVCVCVCLFVYLIINLFVKLFISLSILMFLFLFFNSIDFLLLFYSFFFTFLPVGTEEHSLNTNAIEEDSSVRMQSIRGRKGWGDRSVGHVLAAIDERRSLPFHRYTHTLPLFSHTLLWSLPL